jgi:hypothetical protein
MALQRVSKRPCECEGRDFQRRRENSSPSAIEWRIRLTEKRFHSLIEFCEKPLHRVETEPSSSRKPCHVSGCYARIAIAGRNGLSSGGVNGA